VPNGRREPLERWALVERGGEYSRRPDLLLSFVG
jgi:hypothetical protein